MNMAMTMTLMHGMNGRTVDMASILDVSKAFYDMKPESYADRLASVVCDERGKVYLIGYQWAIYGSIDIKSGIITFYSGWLGYSQTSTLFIRRSAIKGRADVTINEMPTFRGC